MKQRIPEYYHSFQCIGKECKDNCCIGWEIDIDLDTYRKYQAQEGDLGRKLRKNIAIEPETDTRHFILCGERCPFLKQEGLCELICESGEEMLCEICRNHPRFFEWYGPVKESGIGLCCEEAAKWILSSQEKQKFLWEETEEEGGQEKPELYEFFFAARELFFEIAQDRRYHLFERMAELLESAAELQAQITGEAFTLPVMTEEPDRFCSSAAFCGCMAGLEPMDRAWPVKLGQMTEAFKNEAGMAQNIHAAAAYRPWEYENLLVYFLFRYSLKACYDGNLLEKIQFAVLAVMAVLELDALETLRGSTIHRLENAKMFSKEIEYSDENREALLRAFETEEKLSWQSVWRELCRLSREEG